MGETNHNQSLLNTDKKSLFFCLCLISSDWDFFVKIKILIYRGKVHLAKGLIKTLTAYQFTSLNSKRFSLIVFTSYLPAVPRYAPSEASLYFSRSESTIKLSYSAYLAFPSKSAKSTRSRWRLSVVIR